MGVRIVVDSTADVPQEIRSRLTVVPLNVSFNDEHYIDGVTITHQAFYERLATSDVLPKTSQPSPAAYAKVYEEAQQAGDTLVVLAVSSRLSGTYQSAMLAAQDYPGMVHVVDTKHVANGFGVLAEYALLLCEKGSSAQEIVDAINRERDNVEFYALVDTMEYLHRGGRVSKTVAIAGTLLSIKPLVRFTDGGLVMMGKARGLKHGFQHLIREINAAGVDFDKPFLLGYSGISEANVLRFLEDSVQIWAAGKQPARYVPIGSVVGTHAGPGVVSVAFFKKA